MLPEPVGLQPMNQETYSRMNRFASALNDPVTSAPEITCIPGSATALIGPKASYMVLRSMSRFYYPVATNTVSLVIIGTRRMASIITSVSGENILIRVAFLLVA